MKRRKRKVHGWLFRTKGAPPYIRIWMKGDGAMREEKVFPDTVEGTIEAAQCISDLLSREDWKLEDMAFMGYRIYTDDTER